MPRLTIAVAARAGGAPLVQTLDSVLRLPGLECAVSWPANTPVNLARAIRQLSLPRGCAVAPAAAETTGACWNAALAAGSAALCLCLYEGDRVTDGIAEAAADALAFSRVVAAAAPVELTTARLPVHVRVPSAATLAQALADPRRAPHAFVFRRADWARAGFDESLPALAAYELGLRLLARSADAVAIPLEGPSIRREMFPGSWVRAELAPDRHGPALAAVLAAHAAALRQDPAAMLLDRERDALAALTRHRELVARRDAIVAATRKAQQEIRRLEGFLRGHGRAAPEWGDLGRTAPVSRDWGYERGTPVDRVFIEQFIADNAADIRGRVLEVQEPDLTRRFGGAAVGQSDVVDIDPSNPRVTIVADLRAAAAIPDRSYDCVILTQTLHVIDDMAAVVRECHRMLEPGGTLLATLPCASRVCLEYGRDGDFWRVTEAGARQLFEPVFGEDGVQVRGFGNVRVTTAFVQGLAAHEIPPADYDVYDPYHPTLVGVRAHKAVGPDAAAAVPVRARQRGRAVILLYHRVAEPDHDPHGLALPPQAFAEQMALLAARYLPLPLDDALDAAARRHLPHRAVAVTFDDGYLDNLTTAAGILAEHGVPAAFFVTTAPLEDGREFWWDTLARVFAPGSGRPAELDVALGGVRLRMRAATDADRRAAHDAVHGALVRQAPGAIRDAIESLVAWSGGASNGDPIARPVRRGELLQLAASAAHAIGAHGVDHLYLPAQPEPGRAREAAGSRRALQDLLGRDVRWFAYPFGAFDGPSIEAARRAGFDGALTCERRALREGDDLFAAPRVEVRCRSAADLDAQLSQLFEE